MLPGRFYVLLGKKNATVGDLFQAIVAQTGHAVKIKSPINLKVEPTNTSTLLSSLNLPLGTTLLIEKLGNNHNT